MITRVVQNRRQPQRYVRGRTDFSHRILRECMMDLYEYNEALSSKHVCACLNRKIKDVASGHDSNFSAQAKAEVVP